MNNIIYMVHHFTYFLVYLLLSQFACSSECGRESSTDHPQFIPFIEDIIVDGYKKDWPETYQPIRLLSDIRGNSPRPADFTACFRLAWDENGLYLLAEINDNFISEDPEKFWNGDGIEIFISPYQGSFEIVQISLRPSFDLEDSLVDIVFYDHRKSDSLKHISPESTFFGNKSSTGYLLEGHIPLKMIGISESFLNREIALQIYFNDSDQADDTLNVSLPWYPVRDSYRNPYAFHKIVFTENKIPSMPVEIRACIIDDEFLQVKLLSENPSEDRKLAIQSENFSKRFNLYQDSVGIFSNKFILPVNEYLVDKDRIRFLSKDSAFFEIDPIVLHRVYESIPEPNRFEKEIRTFEIIDHFIPPPQNPILITGSSTIRRWNHLGEELPGMKLINRGFGGSTMEDLNYYFERIVFPYDPSIIIIYEGDNDIARGASAVWFVNQCKQFIMLCRKKLPNTEVFFMSIKPSPSRMRNWPEMQIANQLLYEMSATYENVHFLDIAHKLMKENGLPDERLFQKDGLHLNERGYEILTGVLKDALDK